MTPVGVLSWTCYRNQVRISNILSHSVSKKIYTRSLKIVTIGPIRDAAAFKQLSLTDAYKACII